jgi:hypothetical protein
VALEATQCLALGLALGETAGNVVLRRLVAAQLGDGDATEGGVQLAVAAAIEAEARAVAARGRDRRDAGQASEFRRRAEALDAGDLGDQLRGGERPDAGEGEQARLLASDEC